MKAGCRDRIVPIHRALRKMFLGFFERHEMEIELFFRNRNHPGASGTGRFQIRFAKRCGNFTHAVSSVKCERTGKRKRQLLLDDAEVARVVDDFQQIRSVSPAGTYHFEALRI